MIDAVGGAASVDMVAALRPAWSVTGCTPMSANRLTVACRMLGSGVEAITPLPPSRPYDQLIVPAPNTSAPLGAR